MTTGCNTLPNMTTYTRSSETSGSIELSVNISTSKGHTFRPEAFLPALYTEHMMSSRLSANGCDGFFNFSSEDVGYHGACPWNYQCDYNPQRVPAFLFNAHCSSDNPLTGGAGYCKEVYTLVSTMTTESCDPLEEDDAQWQLESKLLPVACTLTKDM